MRIFIGIESCSIHREFQRAIRDTWLKDCDLNYKFFLSNPRNGPVLVPTTDELILPIVDGWFLLLKKFKMEIDWVLKQGYDYMFRCHSDTYVHIPRLLASGFEDYDYVGNPQGGWPRCAPFCYGGSGFWLSYNAMRHLQRVLSQKYWQDRMQHQIEDYDIGTILELCGIKRFADIRYRERGPGPSADNDYITLHESETDGEKEKNLRRGNNMLKAHLEAHK